MSPLELPALQALAREQSKAKSKRGGARKGAGRKPMVDIVELEKLGALDCTQPEVAAFFGIRLDNVERTLQKPEYRLAWERGKAEAKISLRRWQNRTAEAGSATMQIWLGKQRLGQKDRTEISGDLGIALDETSNRETLIAKLTKQAESK